MNKTITAAEVTLAMLPAVRIAYLRYTGPYAGEGIGLHWQRFNQWCAAQTLSGPRTMFGISLDDPQVTPAEQCRYDAAMQVDADFQASGEVLLGDLPGGLYALYEFAGVPSECGAAWTSLFCDWLPQSAYAFDERPCMEIYLPRHACESEHFACQLAIPLRPR